MIVGLRALAARVMIPTAVPKRCRSERKGPSQLSTWRDHSSRDLLDDPP